ncbi:YncE family protein [Streptomyces sp. NPDC006368]|uniref:YncE family protein n=1 Tax=Streptomyces sp. NPDC006368 TaxID=3156760 RepID=UPI0033BC77A3
MIQTRNDVLAVVSQSGPAVVFFDAVTYDRLGEVRVPYEPHELCFDAARRLLYCTITYRSGFYRANTGRARELVVIDPDERRAVEVVDLAPEWAPHGLALDPAGELLWVSVEARGAEEGAPTAEEGALVALEAGSRKPVRRIPVGAPGPHWFVLTPDGRRAYTANKEAPFLSVVDLGAGVTDGRIAMPGGSEGIAVAPDGRYVYVAGPKGDGGGGGARGDGGVRVVDTATGAVVRTLPTEGPVLPVHVTSTGLVLAGELRGAAGGSPPGGQGPGVLHVYEGDAVRARVPVGAFPLTITSSPDGRHGYVAAVSASTVTVVDLAAGAVAATLEVGRPGEPGAHGMAYVSRPTPRPRT